jgi:hypothetical protein
MLTAGAPEIDAREAEDDDDGRQDGKLSLTVSRRWLVSTAISTKT